MIKKSMIALSLLTALHTTSYSAEKGPTDSGNPPASATQITLPTGGDIESQPPAKSWWDSLSNAYATATNYIGTPQQIKTTTTEYASWAWSGVTFSWSGITQFCTHPIATLQTPTALKFLLSCEEKVIVAAFVIGFAYEAHYSMVSLWSNVVTPSAAESLAYLGALISLFSGAAGVWVGEKISGPIIDTQKALYPLYAKFSPHVDYYLAGAIGYLASKAQTRAQKKIAEKKTN